MIGPEFNKMMSDVMNQAQKIKTQEIANKKWFVQEFDNIENLQKFLNDGKVIDNLTTISYNNKIVVTYSTILK